MLVMLVYSFGTQHDWQEGSSSISLTGFQEDNEKGVNMITLAVVGLGTWGHAVCVRRGHQEDDLTVAWIQRKAGGACGRRIGS